MLEPKVSRRKLQKIAKADYDKHLRVGGAMHTHIASSGSVQVRNTLPRIGSTRCTKMQKLAGDGFARRNSHFSVGAVKAYLTFIVESRLSLKHAPRTLHAAAQLILGEEQYDHTPFD